MAARCFGPSLQVVDVSGCGGAVGDAGVMALGAHCPALRAVDLSGTAVTGQVSWAWAGGWVLTGGYSLAERMVAGQCGRGGGSQTSGLLACQMLSKLDR